jgi:hypothetical protein
MNVVDTLEASASLFPRPARSLLRRLPPRLMAGFLLAGSFACSSDDKGDSSPSAAGSSTTAGGGAASGGGGTSGGGSAAVGGSSAKGPFGSFTISLNPAVEDAAAYTAIFGKVYSGPYPTDIIETVIGSDDNCKVYKYSLQACYDPTCPGEQTCVAENVCETKPVPVSVGDVSVAGIGDTSLKLAATNLNYQYPLDLPYPGVTEGEPVTLTGTGDAFPAFTVSATGVAPIATSESSYLITSGEPLTVTWTPGADPGTEVTATLNVSKHGGSAGYVLCKTTDSGTLTIAADVVKALVELGVGGFPELLLKRSTHGESTVGDGKIGLEVESVSKPALNIDGYCSCFNDSDCGSCSDKTKTACDPLKRLCKTP